ncbi:ribonuclease E inhibitor RraB [Asticcacaulis sp. EMRT-3]|uniref:ribonuclease E inhibitor RraB n=1 Tax=Asticcacaulis sp. EMRT-3 TaxID=3040349 RepID=UPI0024AF25D1|nr:ribonuclease E inhibitor RraB [Asticcacaulis sp. EMRT-3]MDI7775800.1 ribonuclease E inhibitor RraB [Asticcacaulis sp. EMRT-3]
MVWDFLVRYRHWLWAVGAAFLCIRLVRVIIYAAKSGQQKNSKRYNSEDGKRFYDYWHDGYDLKPEQLVDFHMSFDSEEKAGEVSFGLTRNFDMIESHIDKNDHGWGLTITLRLIPSSEKMDEIRHELSAAAKHADGTYDGWTLRN